MNKELNRLPLQNVRSARRAMKAELESKQVLVEIHGLRGESRQHYCVELTTGEVVAVPKKKCNHSPNWTRMTIPCRFAIDEAIVGEVVERAFVFGEAVTDYDNI